jgi:hypothetical protein
MRLLTAVSAIALAMVTSVAAHAAACSAKSGATTAALVELYTSEGCDSCPPADRWLSGLKGAKEYAGRAVPLALHVDYWDYIGWRDPFAQAGFSARQQEIAGINRERTVYTPQIVVAGRDLRPGLFSASGGFDMALDKVNRTPPRADLGLDVLTGAPAEFKLQANAKLRNASDTRDAALYVALFENGLSSAVAAGENKGKVLRHDFVVRQWLGPLAFAADGTLNFARNISLQPGWKKQDLGVAAFVQNRSTGEVLQALQLASCN